MALIGPKISWHSLPRDEVKRVLEADFKKGLTRKVVDFRRSKYGKNQFSKSQKVSFSKKIFKQIRNPLVAILIVAGVVTIFLREYVDSVVVLIAVLINIIIGMFQEERASKAFNKLNDSQQRFATVIREGRKFVIPVEDLVQGDLVEVDAGSYIPADLRLIETKNFEVNESALTGEWLDVFKESGEVKRNTPLAEQSNMAWMGTLASSGTARGIVVEIGVKTQMGIISESLTSYVERRLTPIEKNVKSIARFLTVLILVIVMAIFALGIYREQEISQMLLLAVAVAVSVIPEGLPAAVTVTLVLGMERILQKGGLVKNLLAAETLGATTVILTDKTGTLTEGKMKLTSLFTLSTLEDGDKRELDEKELLKMAVLSSDGFIEEDHETSEMVVRGRPVEKAIVLFGLEAGISYLDLVNSDERIDFLPFDSENRFAVSLNKTLGTTQKRMYFSGSPERLLEKSDKVYLGGKVLKLTKETRLRFEKVQEKWSRQGMRFISLAYKETKSRVLIKKDIQNVKEYEDLIYVGLVSFEDSVRKDVPSAILKARNAGARVIMVTGDNRHTAHKIAQDVGIIKDKARVLEGSDIEKMNDKDLLMVLGQVKVFARVLPSQKLRISRVLQNSGEIVAMTGDGINDAPALRGADIGLAVGSGTEVAKEAADMILLDNGFSIIVSAIEEGRRIMDNLKKITSFLLATSFQEIFVIGGALLFGLPLPILAGQILWINIVEEGMMNFAFAFEPTEKGVMKRNPNLASSRTILTGPVRKMILTIGVITGLFATLLYTILLRYGLPIEEIRTIIFAVLALDPIFFSLSFKSLREPLWKIDLFSNRYLLLSMLLSLFLLFGALSFEPLRAILRLTPLSLGQMGLLLGVGLFNLFLIEIAKYFLFVRKGLIT